RQPRIGLPSTRTVQAPHTPCSQPTCDPVSSSSYRRKSTRLWRGSTSRATRAPLTVRTTFTAGPPSRGTPDGTRGERAARGRGDDLAGLERSGVDAAEELVRPDRAAPVAAGDLDARVERHRARGQLGGGVGEREAATDRAARPDRLMPHVGGRLREERGVLAQ